MKIAILNKIFFNESDIQVLAKLGELEIYNDTDTEEKTISRIKDVDIVVANCYIAPFTEKVFKNSRTLKLLVVSSSGYETVDILAAKEMGVQIVTIGNSFSQAVAEHVFGLILAVNKRIPSRDYDIRNYPHVVRLINVVEFHHIGYDLCGKTLGIIGFGETGTKVAKIGLGFGMNIQFYSRSIKKSLRARQVSMNELLSTSDVISIHVPLTTETRYLINKASFELMKSNAIIINTSRSAVVDEYSLFDALKNRKILGAGLDVVSRGEVLENMLSLENVVFSPHVAYLSQESIKNCTKTIISEISNFIFLNSKNSIK